MARCRRAAPPLSEAGFVLLTALWLLLLGGIIAAFVMSSGLQSSRRAREAVNDIEKRLAARSALDAVGYDLLVNGRRSRWANGRSATITAGRYLVTASASDEEMRTDLNAAERDALMHVFGGSPAYGSMAAQAADQVIAERERGRFRTLGDAGRLVQPEGPIACLPEAITVFTGMPRPASVLGVGALDGTDGGTKSRIYRLAASISGRTVERRVMRITGDNHRPIWWLERLTPGAACTARG